MANLSHEELIGQATRWGGKRGKCYIAQIPQLGDLQVAKAELDLIDARLAPFLDEISGNAMHPWISGNDVRAQLELWRACTLPVVTKRGLSMHALNILDFDLQYNELYMEGFPCYTFPTVDGEGIAYVQPITKSYLCVSPGWLEETFPRWRERYDMATSMGLKGKELASLVFPMISTPVFAPALPGFDD